MVLVAQDCNVSEEVAHLLLYWMDRLGVKLPAPAAVAFMTSARCPREVATKGGKVIIQRDENREKQGNVQARRRKYFFL